VREDPAIKEMLSLLKVVRLTVAPLVTNPDRLTVNPPRCKFRIGEFRVGLNSSLEPFDFWTDRQVTMNREQVCFRPDQVQVPQDFLFLVSHSAPEVHDVMIHISDHFILRWVRILQQNSESTRKR